MFECISFSILTLNFLLFIEDCYIIRTNCDLKCTKINESEASACVNTKSCVPDAVKYCDMHNDLTEFVFEELLKLLALSETIYVVCSFMCCVYLSCFLKLIF